MKLNPDCIRDVLLYLEENLSYNHETEGSIEHNTITMHKISKDLHNEKGYDVSNDECYHIVKLFKEKVLGNITV